MKRDDAIDSTPTTDWTFKAERGCVFCHRFYTLPLEDEDQWTAIALDEDPDASDYWRCPRCTAAGRTAPMANRNGVDG